MNLDKTKALPIKQRKFKDNGFGKKEESHLERIFFFLTLSFSPQLVHACTYTGALVSDFTLNAICYTSQLRKRKKNCEEIVCLMRTGSRIFAGFQGARPDHVRVQSSSSCSPREWESFDPRHVTRSSPIGKGF